MLDPLEAYFRLLDAVERKINLTALPLEPPTDETFDRLLIEPLAARVRFPTHEPGLARPRVRGRVAGDPAEDRRPLLDLTMVEAKERKSAFLREAIRILACRHRAVETDAVRGV